MNWEEHYRALGNMYAAAPINDYYKASIHVSKGTAFTTYLTRPSVAGRMRAVGTVVNKQRTQIIAEAVLYDGEDRELARGSGIFVRGKWPLSDVPGYSAE